MKATISNIQAVANEVNNTKTRSAWSKGVKAYAFHILANFEEWQRFNESESLECPELDEVTALNGAQDWNAWAYGGCGLCYDAYIAERLCTPSELKKLRGGARVPAGAATWCDIEARAVRQAWRMIAEAVRVVEYKQVKAEAVEGLQKLHGISEAEAVEQFGYIVEA
jgi:hypothetical protein